MLTKDKIREEIYATLIGALLIIFFALMFQDLYRWLTTDDQEVFESTDTNVEELYCNDPHGYYCSPFDKPADSINL